MYETLEPNHGPPYSVQDIDIHEEHSGFGPTVVVDEPHRTTRLALVDGIAIGAATLSDTARKALTKRGYDTDV